MFDLPCLGNVCEDMGLHCAAEGEFSNLFTVEAETAELIRWVCFSVHSKIFKRADDAILVSSCFQVLVSKIFLFGEDYEFAKIL